MMKYIYISVMLCITLYSCQEGKSYIYKYYKDGNIHQKIEVINDTMPHGEWIEYYPSGKIKIVATRNNGHYEGSNRRFYENGSIQSVLPMNKNKVHGFSEGFYSNGNISWSCQYIDGVKVGLLKAYYQEDNGKILREVFLSKSLSSPEAPFHLIEYDKNGNITKDIKIVDLKTSLDTLKLGEIAYLIIRNTQPVYDSIDVLLGDFDELFNLPENYKLDTIKGENGIVKVPVSFNKKGKHRFRLLVRDYIVEQDKDTTISTALHNYVFYDFYVR